MDNNIYAAAGNRSRSSAGTTWKKRISESTKWNEHQKEFCNNKHRFVAYLRFSRCVLMCLLCRNFPIRCWSLRSFSTAGAVNATANGWTVHVPGGKIGLTVVRRVLSVAFPLPSRCKQLDMNRPTSFGCRGSMSPDGNYGCRAPALLRAPIKSGSS